MAIRFYCPFCDGLLGISSRKAGAAVECPRCRGLVGVPGGVERRQEGIVLTRVQVTLLGIAVLGMAGLAFAAGILVGAKL